MNKNATNWPKQEKLVGSKNLKCLGLRKGIQIQSFSTDNYCLSKEQPHWKTKN